MMMKHVPKKGGMAVRRVRADDKPMINRSRQVLQGTALFGAVLVCIFIAHLCRQARQPVAPFGRTSAGILTHQTESVMQADDGAPADPAALWARLAETYGTETAVLAFNTASPIEVDGLLNESAWSESFETALSEPQGASPVSVRCLWDEDAIHLAVRCPLRTPATQAAGVEARVQVVLGIGDPATRFRFSVDTGGTKDGYRLTCDQALPIGSTVWQGAARRSETEVVAELALPHVCFNRDTLPEADAWSLVVRAESSGAEEPDPSSSPMYWLLDSLRGCRATLILAKADRPAERVSRFANAVFHPGLGALQWDLNRIDLSPDARIEIPVAFRPAGPAGNSHPTIVLPLARLIAPAKSTQRLPVAWDEPDAQQAGLVRRGRVMFEAQGAAGLFEIELRTGDATTPPAAVSWPIWASREAVRSARQYLIQRRQEVDRLAADTWPRSIAAAHVAKALAALETADGLDHRFAGILAGVEAALEALRHNHPPRIPTGTSRLAWGEGHRPVAVTIDVPDHYDDRLAWPIYWGQPGLPNLIGVTGISSADQLASRPLLDESLHLDSDRRYLLAWCEQAYFLTDELIQRPERWAAAVLALRARWSDRAGNAANVPMRFYNHDRGGADVLVMEAAARWMRREGCRIEYVVHPDFPHTALPPAYLPEVAHWLLQYRRSAAPATVCCATHDPAESSKYWVHLDAVAEPRRPAELRAAIEADRIDVQTNDNVRDYTLALDRAPLPPGVKTLRIIEDGQEVGAVSTDGRPLRFRRLPTDNDENPSRKRPGLAGPIAAALKSRRFLVAAGVSDNDPRLSDHRRRAAARIAAAEWVATEPHGLSDLQLTDERMQSADVLLIGDPATDPWIRRLCDRLDIEMDDEGVRLGGRRLPGSNLSMLVLGPNPSNPDRYLLVLAGNEADGVDGAARLLIEQRPPIDDSDCVVLGPAGRTGEPTVLWADRFDWTWRPVAGGEVLARLNRPHPDWQWTQLAAQVVREHTGGDGFFVSRLMRFSPAGLVGPITAHDLYCLMYNDWLVSAQMSPSVLRGLVAKAMRYCPQAVAGGMFETDAPRPGAGFRWSRKIAGGADALVSIATTPVCETPAIGAGGAGCCIHLQAHSCELLPLYTVDVLVSFLKDNPGIDLDALLDQQSQPPTQGGIEAITALEEKSGL